MRGPFELLCEAQRNLERGSEVGRRCALIFFDDAIEVCISTYLGLHPIQRKGKTYKKEKVTKWLANFHSRLDFLDAELTERKRIWEVDRGTIVWSHDYRNDQYHAGRKGIPDQHVLGEARRAALWVFAFLLDVPDAEDVLASAVAALAGPPPPEPNPTYDRAIDAEYGVIEIEGQKYYTSEILFSVDYPAYADLGARLDAPQRGNDEAEDE
ncbi:MAG: hypothetical protein F4150_01010 [Chloroflexi bacterium]|nr:hypothetical protein [Chloroflexota bacterium]